MPTRILHNGDRGEVVTWGWTAKAIVTALASGFVVLCGFLYADRMTFERRLVTLERIADQQAKLISDKKEEHTHFVRQEEFLQLQRRIDDIAMGVDRIEGVLMNAADKKQRGKP